MKKFIVLLSGFAFLLVATFNGALAGELTFGWEPWEPYQFQDQGKLTGLDIDLAKSIVHEAGFTAVFSKRPWKRQLKEVEAGSINALLGASKTPERAKYAFFSDAYRKESVTFYVLKEKKAQMKGKITSLKDLSSSSFNVGVVRGYYYGDDYAKLIKEGAFAKHVKEVVDDTTNFKKLMSSRVDAVMVDPVAATAVFKRNGWVGRIVPLFDVYSDDIYMMMSKKSTTPEDVKKVNASLRTLKENGAYKTIIDSYIQK